MLTYQSLFYAPMHLKLPLQPCRQSNFSLNPTLQSSWKTLSAWNRWERYIYLCNCCNPHAFIDIFHDWKSTMKTTLYTVCRVHYITFLMFYNWFLWEKLWLTYLHIIIIKGVCVIIKSVHTSKKTFFLINAS